VLGKTYRGETREGFIERKNNRAKRVSSEWGRGPTARFAEHSPARCARVETASRPRGGPARYAKADPARRKRSRRPLQEVGSRKTSGQETGSMSDLRFRFLLIRHVFVDRRHEA
jgi:hypothetical protein